MITESIGAGVEAIRDLYANVSAGDIERAARHVTDDFIMHVPGKGANAGEYWGRDGFRAFMRNIVEYNGGTFSLQLRSIASYEDTVFTRELVTLNRRPDPDRLWVLPFVMHYKMRGEQVAEAWTVPEDLYLYDAFWGVPTAKASPEAGAASPVERIGRSNGLAPSNLALLKTLYGYFWSGAFERIQPLYSQDFVFFAPGRGYLSGSYSGWNGYLEFRHKLMAIAGGKYHLDVDAIAASDTEVFAREFIRMNTTKHPAVGAAYVIMRFEITNGLITRADDIPVDLYAWEDLFSR